jgi:hypothetical protein
MRTRSGVYVTKPACARTPTPVFSAAPRLLTKGALRRRYVHMRQMSESGDTVPSPMTSSGLAGDELVKRWGASHGT